MLNKSSIASILGVSILGYSKNLLGSKNNNRQFEHLEEDYINIKIKYQYRYPDNIYDVYLYDSLLGDDFRKIVDAFTKINQEYKEKISKINILEKFRSGFDIHQHYMNYIKRNIPDDIFSSNFNMIGDYISYIESKQRFAIQDFYLRLSEEYPTVTIDDLLFPAFDFQIYGKKDGPYYGPRTPAYRLRSGEYFYHRPECFDLFIIESRMSKNAFDKLCRVKNRSQTTSSSIKESLCDLITDFFRQLIFEMFPRLIDNDIRHFKTNFRVLDCEVWTKDNNKFIEHAILYSSSDTELRKF